MLIIGSLPRKSRLHRRPASFFHANKISGSERVLKHCFIISWVFLIDGSVGNFYGCFARYLKISPRVLRCLYMGSIRFSHKVYLEPDCLIKKL